MKNLQIIGHLGKDAEILKNTGNEFFTVFFQIAHSENFTDKNGEEKTNTIWISCFKRFRKDPSKVIAILKKGMKVYVDGSPNMSIQMLDNGTSILNVSLNVVNLEFMTKKESN